MKDDQNRPYAKTENTKPGDIIIVDQGFTCMEPWSEHVVETGTDVPEIGRLFVRCSCGHHYLDGQRENETEEDLDYYIGMYKKDEFTH